MNVLIGTGYIGIMRDVKYCLDCNAEKSPKGNYCKPCGYKHRAKTGFKKGHKFYPGGEKGWFSKKQEPWNKGTKGLVKPNSGSFKPGEHRSSLTEFRAGEFANELHPGWKGDQVGYHALHSWLTREYGKPSLCEECGSTNKVQWASKDYKYTRPRDAWLHLCYWCHRKYDKRNGWGVASAMFPEIKK